MRRVPLKNRQKRFKRSPTLCVITLRKRRTLHFGSTTEPNFRFLLLFRGFKRNNVPLRQHQMIPEFNKTAHLFYPKPFKVSQNASPQVLIKKKKKSSRRQKTSDGCRAGALNDVFFLHHPRLSWF